MSNNILSAYNPIVAAIDPDAYTAAAYSSGYVDMQKVGKILAIVQTGTLGTNATVDFKLQQATTSGGAGLKDIPGKAITQIKQANSPSESDSQAAINLDQSELDIANGFRYVKCVMTVGTATSDAGAIIIAGNALTSYQGANEASTVLEVIA